MRGYIGNWGYTPNAGSPQKGFVGGCWEDRVIYVENNIAKIRPLIDPTQVAATDKPPAGNGPVWIKARMATANKQAVYALTWSSGAQVTLDIDAAISFDTSKSGKFVYPGQAFAPLPLRSGKVQENIDIDIFINNSCLSVYIDGVQACFQIFPEGRFTGLAWVRGNQRISGVKYYNLAPLFA